MKIGDRVRIRTLDSLLREFGRAHNGLPRVKVIWMHGMSQYCGETGVLTALPRNSGIPYKVCRIALDNTDKQLDFGCFTWSDEVIELVPAEHSEVADLLAMLGPPPPGAICIAG